MKNTITLAGTTIRKLYLVASSWLVNWFICSSNGAFGGLQFIVGDILANLFDLRTDARFLNI